MLGEVHGNEAGPRALWALAEVALEAGEPVTIGIEAPERDSALFEMFLAGDVDRAALFAGAFFGASSFDGRASGGRSSADSSCRPAFAHSKTFSAR